MSLKPYEIDRLAHDLVLKFRDKQDKKNNDVLGESHKMRMATAYGLERFWGEHLRLQRESQDKADFWKETWTTFCKIMKDAGITIPNDPVNLNDANATTAIKAMANKLWTFGMPEKRVNPNDPTAVQPTIDELSEDEIEQYNKQRKIALSVLTELCDSMVWWTQRYKKPRNPKDKK
jgi:hypothetical protein